MKTYATRFSRLQLDEQVEDRRLHGDVERRGRLVADDELRVAGERARDRDALLEPAGELRGRAVRSRSASRTELHQLEHPRARPPCRVRPASLLQRAEQDPPHGVAAVERRVGVLEHDLERAHIVGASARERGGSALPSSSTAPVVGSTMPSSVRASVVLPLPDSPTRPSVSPGQIAAETSDERVDVVAVLLEHLAEVVELAAAASAARSTTGSASSARLARQRLRALVEVAAARVRPPTIDRAAAPRRHRSSASAQRSAKTQPGSSSPEVRAGSPGSCRAARGPCGAAARDAAQQPDRVRVPRLLEDLSRRPSSTSSPA